MVGRDWKINDCKLCEVLARNIALEEEVNTPFTYTDFSYEFLRMAQIHGSLRFATFMTDLRIVTSYLRFIRDYYDVFTEKISRFVTSCHG